MFWPREMWGESKNERGGRGNFFFVLAPIFARPNHRNLCGNPTEALAMQAKRFPRGAFVNGGSVIEMERGKSEGFNYFLLWD